MAHVAQYKKDKIKAIEKEANEYPVIALLDMQGMPADTLQAMRDKLRAHAKIVMTKKRLMKLVFKDMEKNHDKITGLDEHFEGMPALLLTKENPFKIASILKKSRTPANAKAGQIAPKDIVIPAGPTPFAPGPIISELGGIGIKTGVEGGKVAVKADSTVAKKGDVISQKVADVLSRLDIKPMELGLTMTAAYEDGVIYDREILEVDESVYENQLKAAAFEAFAVALHHGVMNEATIMPQIQKAARDAYLLALSENIMTDDTVKQILAKAEGHAGHLKSKINV